MKTKMLVNANERPELIRPREVARELDQHVATIYRLA